jgi:hypothetical protein
MWVILLGEIVQKFREIIPGVQCLQSPGKDAEPLHHVSLNNEIKATRWLAEQDDTAHREKVKCRFKVTL